MSLMTVKTLAKKITMLMLSKKRKNIFLYSWEYVWGYGGNLRDTHLIICKPDDEEVNLNHLGRLKKCVKGQRCWKMGLPTLGSFFNSYQAITCVGSWIRNNLHKFCKTKSIIPSST